MINYIEAKEKMKNWISVNSRLPEDDLLKDSTRKMIKCIVATDKGTVKFCSRIRYEVTKGVLSDWEWNNSFYATPKYWMPLPEHPRFIREDVEKKCWNCYWCKEVKCCNYDTKYYGQIRLDKDKCNKFKPNV